MVVCLNLAAAAAYAAPYVAGVRLGMTSDAVLATLKSSGIAVTRTSFKPCLRDDLARASGASSATGPGRCVQEVDARYAGGDLLLRFIEDLPKNPGSSIVATISINYATDNAAFESILQRAGRPSITDGKIPWVIAAWCFDFVCSDFNHALSEPTSGMKLFVNRSDGPGLTLDDERMRTSHVPDFRQPRGGDHKRNYAPTPRQAVQYMLYTLNGTPVVFERVNVVGRYAEVLSNGEIMPEAANHQPMLLERFTFGWQPLMPGPSRCEIAGRSVSARDMELLLHGMPKPADDRPCSHLRANGDVGPPAAVEALRRLRHDRYVPSVIVANDFALVAWTNGPDGGAALYRKRNGRWIQLTGAAAPQC